MAREYWILRTNAESCNRSNEECIPNAAREGEALECCIDRNALRGICALFPIQLEGFACNFQCSRAKFAAVALLYFKRSKAEARRAEALRSLICKISSSYTQEYCAIFCANLSLQIAKEVNKRGPESRATSMQSLSIAAIRWKLSIVIYRHILCKFFSKFE